jgi:DNA-binding transcriptional LysR family regulator
MDVRRLLIFGEVIRAGSLGAAARTLGWSQPAVSQHVRALEREAGQPLLVRGARGVRPTQAGRVLLVHAEAVAARLRAAEAELASLADARSGTLRLATFPTAGATIVASAMAVLAREHPGVEIRLTDAEPPEALDALAAGGVDAALVFRYDDEPARIAAPLVEHEFARDGTRLVLPLGHPLLARGGLRLADVAGERWVAGCVRCREHLVRVCGREGFVPDIRHSTDDYVIVQSLVAAGLAVALLPETALAVVPRRDVGARPVDGAGYRRISLVHHGDAAAIPALGILRAALSRAALALERAPGC